MMANWVGIRTQKERVQQTWRTKDCVQPTAETEVQYESAVVREESIRYQAEKTIMAAINDDRNKILELRRQLSEKTHDQEHVIKKLTEREQANQAFIDSLNSQVETKQFIDQCLKKNAPVPLNYRDDSRTFIPRETKQGFFMKWILWLLMYLCPWPLNEPRDNINIVIGGEILSMPRGKSTLYKTQDRKINSNILKGEDTIGSLMDMMCMLITGLFCGLALFGNWTHVSMALMIILSILWFYEDMKDLKRSLQKDFHGLSRMLDQRYKTNGTNMVLLMVCIYGTLGYSNLNVAGVSLITGLFGLWLISSNIGEHMKNGLQYACLFLAPALSLNILVGHKMGLTAEFLFAISSVLTAVLGTRDHGLTAQLASISLLSGAAQLLISVSILIGPWASLSMVAFHCWVTFEMKAVIKSAFEEMERIGTPLGLIKGSLRSMYYILRSLTLRSVIQREQKQYQLSWSENAIYLFANAEGTPMSFFEGLPIHFTHNAIIMYNSLENDMRMIIDSKGWNNGYLVLFKSTLKAFYFGYGILFMKLIGEALYDFGETQTLCLRDRDPSWKSQAVQSYLDKSHNKMIKFYSEIVQGRDGLWAMTKEKHQAIRDWYELVVTVGTTSMTVGELIVFMRSKSKTSASTETEEYQSWVKALIPSLAELCEKIDIPTPRRLRSQVLQVKATDFNNIIKLVAEMKEEAERRGGGQGTQTRRRQEQPYFGKPELFYTLYIESKLNTLAVVPPMPTPIKETDGSAVSKWRLAPLSVHQATAAQKQKYDLHNVDDIMKKFLSYADKLDKVVVEARELRNKYKQLRENRQLTNEQMKSKEANMRKRNPRLFLAMVSSDDGFKGLVNSYTYAAKEIRRGVAKEMIKDMGTGGSAGGTVILKTNQGSICRQIAHIVALNHAYVKASDNYEADEEKHLRIPFGLAKPITLELCDLLGTKLGLNQMTDMHNAPNISETTRAYLKFITEWADTVYIHSFFGIPSRNRCLAWISTMEPTLSYYSFLQNEIDSKMKTSFVAAQYGYLVQARKDTEGGDNHALRSLTYALYWMMHQIMKDWGITSYDGLIEGNPLSVTVQKVAEGGAAPGPNQQQEWENAYSNRQWYQQASQGQAEMGREKQRDERFSDTDDDDGGLE